MNEATEKFMVRQLIEFGANGLFIRNIRLFDEEKDANAFVVELNAKTQVMGDAAMTHPAHGDLGPCSQALGGMLGMTKIAHLVEKIPCGAPSRIVVAGPGGMPLLNRN